MTAELPPIFARFDHEWRKGDREFARSLARQYVFENYDAIKADLGGKRIDELVVLVEMYRAEKREAERILVDMWIMVTAGNAASKKPQPTTLPDWLMNIPMMAAPIAYQEEWRRDRVRARRMAQSFVDTMRRDPNFAPFERLTLEDCVQLLDLAREIENETVREAKVALLDCWIAGAYDPQVITGVFDPDSVGGVIRAAAFGRQHKRD